MLRIAWCFAAWCWLAAFQSSAYPQSIWLTPAEIAALPTSGPAWEHLQEAADLPAGVPNLSDQTQKNNVLVLAKALVFARTGKVRYRDQVIEHCRMAIGTEVAGSTLSLGRELCAYVIAADLVQYRDPEFEEWLRTCRTETLKDRTLIDTHEKRPNNWGTHAGASRLAVALYLNDKAEVARCAEVFRGWLGDTSVETRYRYGKDRSWCHDPKQPLGINPLGAVKNGFSIDGVIPDDMRRGGPFQIPPEPTGYPWEGMQGTLVQAELLHRQGFPAYEWQDKAVLRAVKFLYRLGWEPEGDDCWQVWIINRRYGTTYPADPQPSPGKNMGWTNWTHG